MPDNLQTAQVALTNYLYQKGTSDAPVAKQAFDLIAYMHKEGFVFCKTDTYLARGRCVVPVYPKSQPSKSAPGDVVRRAPVGFDCS